MENRYLLKLRGGGELNGRERLLMVIQLSLPAILAQISSIIMQYIDASMVGRLGAAGSASIGLVASSSWVVGGMCESCAAGFSVLVAQAIGGGRERDARSIMKSGFIVSVSFSIFMALVGALISRPLPGWLGGAPEVVTDASKYFLVFVLALPVTEMNVVSGGMLQASGNMKLPSMLYILMCLLDVVFNAFLIFPELPVPWLRLPGAGLGVLGAALGTALSQLVIAAVMTYMLLARSPILRVRRGEKLSCRISDIRNSVRISVPVAVQHLISGGAQVVTTLIIAPIGTVAIAAHSFAITVEGLCYMPGMGISSAATTIVGQSVGAGRREDAKRLGWLLIITGVVVMTFMGLLMYLFAPFMTGIMSNDAAATGLASEVLRIEAFAEPLYAASIVASGVFRGAGDTLVPSCISFGSMWLLRLPAAALLAGKFGLRGIWIAIAGELCFRGILFLVRMIRGKWLSGA